MASFNAQIRAMSAFDWSLVFHDGHNISLYCPEKSRSALFKAPRHWENSSVFFRLIKATVFFSLLLLITLSSCECPDPGCYRSSPKVPSSTTLFNSSLKSLNPLLCFRHFCFYPRQGGSKGAREGEKSILMAYVFPKKPLRILFSSLIRRRELTLPYNNVYIYIKVERGIAHDEL